MNKDILNKVKSIYEQNNKEIVLTKTINYYCYAVLNLGVRVFCFKNYSTLQYNNTEVATFTKDDHEDLFKTLIHFNDINQREKDIAAKKQFLELNPESNLINEFTRTAFIKRG